MKHVSERYEQSIHATERAVASMQADYASAGNAPTYIRRLWFDMHSDPAYLAAATAINDRGHVFMLTRGRHGMTYPTDIPLFYDHRGVPDGLVLGLEACRRVIGNSFNSVMAPHIEQTLASNDQHPMRYADEVVARSTNVYDFALDAPVLPRVSSDPDALPSSHLRDFAETVRTDMGGDYVYDKYFKVGVGIARHAYNAYVLAESQNFDDMLRASGFTDRDFGV